MNIPKINKDTLREMVSPPHINHTNNESKWNRPVFLWLRAWVLLLIGSFLCDIAINIFYLPFNFTMGGVSGLSAIFYYLSGRTIPFGTLTFLINIPILIIGLKEVSLRFVWKSLVGTFFFAFSLDITYPFMTKWFESLHTKVLGQYPDPMIFAIIGGIIFGIGLGMIFLGGYTTGGMDIIAVVIHKHMKSISLGKIFLFLDVVIIGCMLFLPESVNSGASPVLLAMFSFVSLYISTKAFDLMISGFNFSQKCFVISDKSEEIGKAILHQLNRGATLLHGKGMYTGQEKNVLLCVMPTKQIVQLKDLVYSIDPKAFVIVSEAKEVHGEGFSGSKQLF